MISLMRSVAWLSVGVGLLACSSSPTIVSDSFDSGTDRPQTGGVSGKDGGLDGASCLGSGTIAELQAAGSIGPLSTLDKPRPAFGWTYVGLTGVGGEVPSDAGQTGDGGAAARCQTLPGLGPNNRGLSCRGNAQLQLRTTGPVVAFADGTELAWNGDLAARMAPYVQQPSGDAVWVDYEMSWNASHPFADYLHIDNTLELRDGEGGKVRFFTQVGVDLPPLPDAQVTDLFGVAAQAVPSCSFRATGGCTTFDRTEYDHVLLTTPTQMIHDASWDNAVPIEAPNGEYYVYWASSAETNLDLNVTTCTDGPGVATDNGFVATLVAP